jgi:hypothetical protein
MSSHFLLCRTTIFFEHLMAKQKNAEYVFSGTSLKQFELTSSAIQDLKRSNGIAVRRLNRLSKSKQRALVLGRRQRQSAAMTFDSHGQV